MSTVEFINFLLTVLSDPETKLRVSTAVPNPVLFSPGPRAFSDELTRQLIDLIVAIAPAIPSGCAGDDFIESLFRWSSADGRAHVSAADSNGGSGGYLEYLFRYATKAIYDVDIWGTQLEYVCGRNEDFADVTYGGVGLNRLKFARAYGFRNIQSVMLKMKTKKCNYDFVEVMACPRGCLNGGGQFKPTQSETPAAIKTRVGEVQELLKETVLQHPDESRLVQWLYGPLGINSRPGSEAATSLFHTKYHAIPKLDELAPLAAKW